jgi:hypothetical protein
LHTALRYDIFKCSQGTYLKCLEKVMEEKDFRPDYMKVLKAIRSIGHLPQDAIRDIVDNGFDAGASEVGVYFNEKPTRAKDRKELLNVIIVDNGKGMSKFELTKSLVPADTGRDRDSETELGKFGIGLLASGLSFANKIEVITKGVNGYFYTYISYTEKLQTRNPINMVRPCTPEEVSLINPYLKSNPTGTMVIISEIDRLPATNRIVDDLRQQTTFSISRGYYHLKDKTVVKIDGKPVRYYDALERNNCIEVSREYKIPVLKDAYGNTLVNEFITVSMSMIRTADSKLVEREFPALQNPTQRGQGFSVVRNGRELCWGQTFGMWKTTDPNNQFRGEIRYSGKYLDEYLFDVSVTKDRVHILDKSVYDKIDEYRKEFFKSVIKPRSVDQKTYKDAFTALMALENESEGKTAVKKTSVTKSGKTAIVQQNPFVVKLLSIDMENTTPFKAMQILSELREDAQKYQTSYDKTVTG